MGKGAIPVWWIAILGQTPPVFPNECTSADLWQQGWESTATSSPDYYANLKFERRTRWSTLPLRIPIR